MQYLLIFFILYSSVKNKFQFLLIFFTLKFVKIIIIIENLKNILVHIRKTLKNSYFSDIENVSINKRLRSKMKISF